MNKAEQETYNLFDELKDISQQARSEHDAKVLNGMLVLVSNLVAEYSFCDEEPETSKQAERVIHSVRTRLNLLGHEPKATRTL